MVTDEDNVRDNGMWREMMASRENAMTVFILVATTAGIITWLISFVAFVQVAALVAVMVTLGMVGGRVHSYYVTGLDK